METLAIVFIATIVFVIVFVCGRTIASWNSAEHIGRVGEARVTRKLNRLPADEYVVFNDIMVMDSNGITTQIDHAVVSRFGIFVIETKCYSGWIFCNEKSRVWTQTLPYGASSEKNSFQNPIKQNWRHIYVLSERLGLPKRYFFNVVVFTGTAEFKTEIPDNVVNECDIDSYIRSFGQQMISPFDKDRIIVNIQKLNDSVTEYQRANHVHMLHVEHSPSPIVDAKGKTPICPRCGAAMRIRYRRSDDVPFYGCSRYPTCKGIVNIR